MNKPFILHWWNGETSKFSTEESVLRNARKFHLDHKEAWGKVTYHPYGPQHHVYFLYDFSVNKWIQHNSITKDNHYVDINNIPTEW